MAGSCPDRVSAARRALAARRQGRARAASPADVSAVQTSRCKFPDVPRGSSILSRRGGEQTESGIRSRSRETEPAGGIEAEGGFGFPLPGSAPWQEERRAHLAVPSLHPSPARMRDERRSPAASSAKKGIRSWLQGAFPRRCLCVLPLLRVSSCGAAPCFLQLLSQEAGSGALL